MYLKVFYRRMEVNGGFVAVQMCVETVSGGVLVVPGVVLTVSEGLLRVSVRLFESYLKGGRCFKVVLRCVPELVLRVSTGGLRVSGGVLWV